MPEPPTLLGVGLCIGGLVALIKGKEITAADGTQTVIRDWPVVVGLLVGGLAAMKLGNGMLGIFSPFRKLRLLQHGLRQHHTLAE